MRTLVICDRLRRQVKTIVEGPPRKLIEAVAENIATDVLATHGAVQDITVRVKKPHVALEGVIDTLGEASSLMKLRCMSK